MYKEGQRASLTGYMESERPLGLKDKPLDLVHSQVTTTSSLQFKKFPAKFARKVHLPQNKLTQFGVCARLPAVHIHTNTFISR